MVVKEMIVVVMAKVIIRIMVFEVKVIIMITVFEVQINDEMEV